MTTILQCELYNFGVKLVGYTNADCIQVHLCNHGLVVFVDMGNAKLLRTLLCFWLYDIRNGYEVDQVRKF
jgi:hypothetical protein